MKVFYAILPERSILADPFNNFIQLANRAGELGCIAVTIPRMRPDDARNLICQEFLRLAKEPDDVIIMLDADHLHSKDIIERLVADDKPVVTALAFRSNASEPFPCFWVRENGEIVMPTTWEKGLVQAAVVGTGAIAIKRWVLQKLIDADWDEGFFKYQYHAGGKSSSEEIFFSVLCEKEGIPVFVDTTLVTPHCASGVIDESSWEQWLADHPRKNHKVSVIIPQRGRIESFRKCLGSLAHTAPSVEIICVIDDDDPESQAVLHDNSTRFIVVPRMRAIDKWNLGAVEATGDVLMVAANDVEFKPDWLERSLEALDRVGDGMAVPNDGHTDPEVSSPHFLVTRKFLIEHNGGVLMPPCYGGQFPDVEVRHKAQALGKYAVAIDAFILHSHPLLDPAVPVDELYREGYVKYYEQDRELFLRRSKEGFPTVWEPILK